MKRTTRKHLKEDKFQKLITRFVEFVKNNKKQILMAVAAAALSVVIFIAVQIINAQNLKKQNAQLNRIRSLSAELSEKPENLQELEKLAGAGKFARLAYIEMAKYWIEKGDIGRARSALGKVGGEKDFFYYQARDLLGQTFLSQEEYAQAIDVYREIQEAAPDDYVLDVVMFHLAEAYEGNGNIDEALALYKEVQEKYPQTYYGNDAAAKISELEEKK